MSEKEMNVDKEKYQEHLANQIVANLSAEELAFLEQQGVGAGYPQEEEKTNIFSLFKDIIKTDKTTKVANFNDEDLYNSRLLLTSGNFASTIGLIEISDYLERDAEIIAATSLGYKGKLLSTMITQKRESNTKFGEKRGGKKWTQNQNNPNQQE